MNADLENTLASLGGETKRLVKAMKGAFPEDKPFGVECRARGIPFVWRPAISGLAAAASLVAIFSFCALSRRNVQSAAARTVPREYALAYMAGGEAVREIVRTQRPDGSWGSDFLTEQNAGALKVCGIAGEPYRKAVRYLRAKGLSPMDAETLKRRGAILYSPKSMKL